MMHGARWRSTLETRLEERDDRGVALLTALMFMVFATGLSLVLLSAILSQAVPTYTAQKNTRTVYAAEAGLQSALAVIRSAAAPVDASGHVYGTAAKLPCTVTGEVSADGTGATYSVTVQYFTLNPADLTASQRATSALACTPAGVSIVPRYAYVTSKGEAAAIPGNANAAIGNRTLSAIYTFRITNLNIAGGMIHAGNFCLEAVTATTGSNVKFVPAADCLKTPLQLWNYAADYQLKLASSTAGGSPGLCITGPITTPAGAATSGDAVLEICRTDSSRWNQLWSWTGDYTWRAQNSTNTNVSNFYLSPGAVGVGSLLKVSNGVNGKFAPSLEIGAGAASYATHQLVNYREFGRCADVTNAAIATAYMISYPCKQDPTGTGINMLWNHKWYYTEPVPPATTSPVQEIYVHTGAPATDENKRCLSRGAGNDVVFKICDNSADQEWTRSNNTLNYDSSYLVINQGKCLFADTSSVHTVSGISSSKLRMATCNGSLAQKWNAPPTATNATVGGYTEVAG